MEKSGMAEKSIRTAATRSHCGLLIVDCGMKVPATGVNQKSEIRNQQLT
jgi:hypothetical protein